MKPKIRPAVCVHCKAKITKGAPIHIYDEDLSERSGWRKTTFEVRTCTRCRLAWTKGTEKVSMDDPDWRDRLEAMIRASQAREVADALGVAGVGPNTYQEFRSGDPRMKKWIEDTHRARRNGLWEHLDNSRYFPGDTGDVSLPPGYGDIQSGPDIPGNYGQG
jgi:hypothetical protein